MSDPRVLVKKGQRYSHRPTSGGHRRHLVVLGIRDRKNQPRARCREVTRNGTRKQGGPMANVEFVVYLAMTNEGYKMPIKYEAEEE